jgi:hypothetical protein
MAKPQIDPVEKQWDNCLEKNPTFECHPQLDNVINKLKEIL